MFDSFNGLPLHPLVVHAVVVLLPLTIIGAVVVALRPAWRQTYGWLVVALGVVGTALIPVATSSGEALEKRVGDPGEHAELGDQLLWFALPMVVLLVVMLLLDRAGSARKAITTGVAVLAVVASVAAGVQVYRVGDSGARAAWGDTPAAAR
ncbi:DUF2231 domain-containing protein [Solicola sp. PLA-1-18]|uniref:DUF2231 domain-containing protein n=1 Tax=Solicola sp. PLA-1-18 TaxID=3380532 RepID=UPI003B75F3DD